MQQSDVGWGFCLGCKCTDCGDACNGATMCSSGRKFDSEKPRMELLPLDALEVIAEVLTFGAKKYEPDNWKRVPDAENRYIGALLRHLTAVQRGEKVDPETGLSHMAHLGCNALFLLWFEMNKEKEHKNETVQND